MERPQRERLPGLESYGDRNARFTITSHPAGGPAPDNIKDQWLGITFDVGNEDVVVIEPDTFDDSREKPYTAIRVTYADALQKLQVAGRVEAVRFWHDQVRLKKQQLTDHLFFNGECGRMLVPQEDTEILLGTNEWGWPRFDKIPLQETSNQVE